MRSPAFFLLLFCCVVSVDRAYGRCPDLSRDKLARQVLEYLKPLSGQFRLGSCLVEIHTCEELGQTDSNLIADILITTSSGFERYLPVFTSPMKDSKVLETGWVTGPTMRYRYRDLYRDSVSGKDERWAIEMRKSEDPKALLYIEAGYSSQVERKNKTHKRWIVCGEERERDHNEKPVLNFFRSLRSWLILWGEPNDPPERFGG